MIPGEKRKEKKKKNKKRTKKKKKERKKENPYPVVINDVDDGGGLAGIGTVVDEDHTANLNKAGEERLFF